jgi:hypothetical protein
VALAPGVHTFGPSNGTLTVHTQKAGAAAKAGHNLLMEVTRWRGHVVAGRHMAIALTADAGSFRVVEGTGGMLPLGDEEKAAIAQTIDEEVLQGGTIAFRSSAVEPDAGGGRLDVRGELDLLGFRHPIAFVLDVGEDGRLTGRAEVRQTDWQMKPYTALFGTLKVADVVEVAIDARVPAAPQLQTTATRSRTDG